MRTCSEGPIPNWLPAGKRAAVCFTIDDVHPAKSTDAYEAGGDLGKGALAHVEWLLRRHPELWVTLFVTPDWREICPTATRNLLARLPFIRDCAYLTPVLTAGTMRLSRHPDFVAYLRGLPRVEIGLHGLHHVHRGRKITTEFQNESAGRCRRAVAKSLSIFREAGLPHVMGMNPPGWDLPAGLSRALADLDFSFVTSARDIRTPISPTAATDMSGLKGVSLIHPHRTQGGNLLHFTSNFQATSKIGRAYKVIEAGGLLAVKAHIVKRAVGHMALDGIDEAYRNYLDAVFSSLKERYGGSIWWSSMGAIAEHVASLDAKAVMA
jgi:hypothetical protein